MKGNKGITLIALAITVVVLIILAGISISTLVSNDGIIKQAQKSVNSADEFQNNFTKKESSLINEISGSNKANLICNDVSESSITVKLNGTGLKNYQFSLDGNNWTAVQESNMYTFSNLEKTVVNIQNYQTQRGKEYKVYAKAINSDGVEISTSPLTVKTQVVVDSDSSQFIYNDLGAEIYITGLNYLDLIDNPSTTSELDERISKLQAPVLIPSYIDGKSVTKIAASLLQEKVINNPSEDGKYYIFKYDDANNATKEMESSYSSTDYEEGKRFSWTMRNISNDTKYKFYVFTKNSYGVLEQSFSSDTSSIKFDVEANSSELVLPPTIKEIINDISTTALSGKINELTSIVKFLGELKFENKIQNVNNAIPNLVYTKVGNSCTIFCTLNATVKKTSITFLGRDNYSDIINSNVLDSILTKATEKDLKFYK